MAGRRAGDKPPTRQVECRVRLTDISASTFTFLLLMLECLRIPMAQHFQVRRGAGD